MRTPAHRRKRDPFRRAIPAPRIRVGIPRCRPCDKLAYPTMAEADLVRRRREVDGPLRVYECPRGNGWHLTSLEAA